MDLFNSFGGGGGLVDYGWSKPEWDSVLGSGPTSFDEPYPARPEDGFDWEKWGEYMGSQKSPEQARAPQLPGMQSPDMGMNMMGPMGQQPYQNVMQPQRLGGPVGRYALSLMEI